LIALVWLSGNGFTSRRTALPGEARIARAARAFLVPSEIKNASNPMATDTESVRRGMEHFADHCASCHANDGSGNAEVGRSLFPPAPDMRADATQSMSDGELFYVIEQGIPFTGMPAWGTGTAMGEHSSWDLVSFIRHLPELSQEEIEEMEAMNPRSPSGTVPREVLDFLEGR